MWLPDILYKRAPYYWMLLGILFVALGTYRASQGDFPVGLTCLVAGVTSCFWSLHVGLRRRTRAEDVGNDVADDVDLDQTCELTYRPE